MAVAQILQWYAGDLVSEMGRTRIEIVCPCCQQVQWGYTWSLAGSGKRCENKACRAMFAWLDQRCTPNLIPVEIGIEQ